MSVGALQTILLLLIITQSVFVILILRWIRRGTKIENRRRRGVWRILAGTIILSGAGIFAWTKCDHCDLTPTWVLLLRVRESGSDAESAIDRLVRRSETGRLSAGENSSLVAIFLDEPAGEILRSWCDIVEKARLDENVSDEQWEQFWRRHTQIIMLFRPRARRSRPIPVRFSTRDLMWNLGSNHNHPWKMTCKSLEINGIKWEPPSGLPVGRNRRLWNPDSDEELVLPPEILSHMHDGPQVVTAVLEAQDGYKKVHATLSANFNFVPDQAPAIDMIKADKTTGEAIRNGLKISLKRNGEQSVFLGVDNVHTVVNLYFRAYLVCGDKTFEMPERLISPKGSDWRGGGGDIKLDFPIPPSADVILRPDPDGALHTADMDQIWGQDIVFKNVPIK